MHASILLLLAATSLPPVANGASVTSAPEFSYLLQVTREWSKVAGLGDLREAALGEEDIELRVWGGYGLGGTRAAIVRRIDGTWQGLTVDVREYVAASTKALADSEGVLPPCVIEEMTHRCTVDPMEVSPAASRAVGHLYHLDCPQVLDAIEDHAQATYEEVWRDLVRHGVLTLPPEIDRDWVMLDGHTYVIELRTGTTYRASAIEHVAPEVEADGQVQAIVRRLDAMLHASVYTAWDESESSGGSPAEVVR